MKNPYDLEEEFLPYELCVQLKELGFDEPCLRGWDIYRPDSIYLREPASAKFYGKQSRKMDHIVKAPLWQQAFRWFREKYDLVIEPCVPFQRLYSTEEDHFEILEFGYRIYSFDQFRGGLRDKIEWDGYDNSNEEEAELECLKKLIEMVKKIKLNEITK